MGTDFKSESKEILYDKTNITDETREMDGLIADYRYVNPQWIFIALRNDRKHPNGKNTLKRIVYTICFNHKYFNLKKIETGFLRTGKMVAFNKPVTRQVLLDYVTKPDATLLDDEQIDGVHLLRKFDLVSQMQVPVDPYIHGPISFFTVMQYGPLTSKNASQLFSSIKYVMAPKPVGQRYLLYVDSSGQIFLENMTQHVFRVGNDRTVKMLSPDGQPITDTVLDGTLTREKQGPDDTGGKLTFVIQDALRCSGQDVRERETLWND